jgi:hypothetical protein
VSEATSIKGCSLLIAGVVVFAAASGAVLLGTIVMNELSDERACQAALDEGTPEALEGYLSMHPRGDCVVTVQTRLGQR